MRWHEARPYAFTSSKSLSKSNLTKVRCGEKITVAGNILLGAYTIYSGYPGAIDATERLCKKANLFGDYVCSSFIKETGATPEQVARVESRTKTPGKLLKALRRLEKLDKAATTMSKESLQSELHAANAQLSGAISGLSDEERKVLDNDLTFHNLPPISDLPKKDRLVADIPKAGITVRGAKLEIGKYSIEGEGLTIKPEKRRRLKYRNKFTVDPDEKR